MTLDQALEILLANAPGVVVLFLAFNRRLKRVEAKLETLCRNTDPPDPPASREADDTPRIGHRRAS